MVMEASLENLSPNIWDAHAVLLQILPDRAWPVKRPDCCYMKGESGQDWRSKDDTQTVGCKNSLN